MRIKRESIFFFFPYGVFMFFSILSTSFYYKYFYGILYTSILVFCLSLIILGLLFDYNQRLKSVVGLMVCLAIYVLLGFINGNFFSTIAYIPIFIYASRNIEFSRIASFTIKISLVTVLFVVLSSYIGVIDNYVVYASSGRVREFLGFRYALYPSAFVFNITCLWLYLKKNAIKWREMVFLLIINYTIYYKTDSRLSFYLAVALIVIFTLDKIRHNFILNRKLIMRIFTMSFVICFLGSIYLVYMYSKGVSWAETVNDVLGNRLLYAYHSLVSNGVSIWGKYINWNGYGLDIYGNVSDTTVSGYTYVDCMYIHMLQRFGIVISIIYLIVFTLTMIKNYKDKEYFAVLILTFYALHSMVDDLALYLYYNTFWFIIGSTLISTISRNDGLFLSKKANGEEKTHEKAKIAKA